MNKLKTKAKKILKNNKGKTKGITLIALVITIIIILILAGISITALSGDNGLINNAIRAREENRGATVEEEKEIWEINKEAYNDNSKSVEEFIQELVNRNLLSEEEKDTILGNEQKGIEATGKITIGEREIVFFEVEEIEDYKEYVLVADFDSLEINLNSNVREYFLNKIQDEDIFMAVSKAPYNSFEQLVNEMYEQGEINQKYDNLRDLMVIRRWYFRRNIWRANKWIKKCMETNYNRARVYIPKW